MKLLQVVLDLGRESTGVQTTALNFARALAQLGHSVRTMSFDRARHAAEERPSNTISIRSLACEPFRRYAFSPQAAAGGWNSEWHGCSGVFIHSLYGHHFTWAARRCRELGLRSYVVPHGGLRDYCFQYRRLRKLVWLRSVRRFIEENATFVFSSEYELEQAAHYIRPARSVVMNWPVGEDLMEAAAADPAAREPGLRTLLWVGRLHPMKRPLETAAAFVRAREPGWRLLFAGPPSEAVSPDDLRRACGAEWGKSVQYLGELGASDLRHLYGSADGLVLFSQGENFANVVAEALVNGGRAYVTTDIGLAGHVARHGCGSVFRVATMADAEDAFRSIMRGHVPLTGEESARIAAIARAEFGFDAFQLNLRDLLEAPGARRSAA
jgi:glycosyltransferase involved in cell wall biosynthesis